MLLSTGIILINGWTNATNAIAKSTRSLKPRIDIIMAAIFEFIRVYFMTIFNAIVAATIANMVALSTTLFAIVSRATAACYYGVPTSESHALIAL